MNAAASSSALPPISPNHDHGFGLRVRGKQRQRINKGCPDQRIAADPDAGRLSQSQRRQLMNGFVSQCPALRDDAHAARFADMAGNDAGLGLSRR
jgi:hypothetical protein